MTEAFFIWLLCSIPAALFIAHFMHVGKGE